MRLRQRPTSVLAALLIATSFGVPASPVRAGVDPADPKVVIVVGPVGDINPNYIKGADEVAAEAAKYTTNVVKIYTPKATWSKVKAAMQGASIFVFFGHGNGWPSPYPPFQTKTKDGLGLDPPTGADGNKHTYYGEDYIRNEVRFAPNAVVLLYHLCYAAGSSESGHPEPSFSVARQRVDNFGAGFLDAGARMVFASAKSSHTDYIRQLFATRRTMDQIFSASPDSNGHITSAYASSRTPGLKFRLDPDTGGSSPSGFYRSAVGDFSLTSSKVTGTRYAPTDEVPLDFVVPGAAEVTAPSGIGLFATEAGVADPASSPIAVLPLGTRLRLTSKAATIPRLFGAATLDGSLTGFVAETSLAPRDSFGVTAYSLDTSSSLLTPDGDGTNDSFSLSVRLSERLPTTLVIRDAGNGVRRTKGQTGDILRFDDDLKTGGVTWPDGTYTWRLTAADAWGNAGLDRSGTFKIDRDPPVTTAAVAATPGSAGYLRSSAQVTLTAIDTVSGSGSTTYTVDGGAKQTYVGAFTVAGDGTHHLTFASTDAAGNAEAPKSLDLQIDATKPTATVTLAGPMGEPGFYRGPVSATMAVGDTGSGIAASTYAIDDGPPGDTDVLAHVVSGEGPHAISLEAGDRAGNANTTVARFTIDLTPPAISSASGSRPTITPGGGSGASASLPISLSEDGAVSATITDSAGTTVRTLTGRRSAGDSTIAWDGTDGSGRIVADGRYTVTMSVTDRAGNASVTPASGEIDVYGALAVVSRSASLFYPQDGDTLSKSVKLSFKLLRPASVTVEVVDARGAVVRTAYVDRPFGAGTQIYTWNGKRNDGTFAPRGLYRLVVRATNGAQSATLSSSVRADAFRLTTSSTVATGGKALTLTVTSAEPLRTGTKPKITVSGLGQKTRTLTMTHVSGRTWKVRFAPTRTLAGDLNIKVSGIDKLRHTNRSTFVVPGR